MNADYIEVNGGKVYYETAGVGETVTLVHAGFVDSRMWDDQWGALARQVGCGGRAGLALG